MNDFYDIKERSSLRTKLVRHVSDTPGRAKWWFNYGKLTDIKFFFEFSAEMPVGNKSATLFDHSYQFSTSDPSLVNPDSEKLAELFASLVIKSVEKFNLDEAENKITYVEVDKMTKAWKAMLKEHEADPPKENWLVKSEKDEKRYIVNGLALFSTFFAIAFNIYLFILIFLQLLDFKSDRLSILNYGFAIMIGFSSVCFSWSRNVLPLNKYRSERLNDCGSEALFGAVAFLMGIAFQHVVVTRDVTFLSDILNYNWLSYTIKFLALVCFFVATFSATRVIKEILLITMLNRLESYDKRKDWRQHE